MIDNVQIGKRIKELRILANTSQAFVARRLNISCSSLSKIENGLVEIKLNIISQLAETFRCDTDLLLR